MRDWIASTQPAIWLSDDQFKLKDIRTLPNTYRYFWPARSVLSRRKRFGTPMIERGLTWYEYQELYVSQLMTPLTIAFAFVATHNHFVLARGETVFNRSAPVIKLAASTDEDAHFGLLGLLNSSLACFWLKEVSHNKGSTVDDRGARQRTDAFEDFYEFTGTKLEEFPLCKIRPTKLARELDALSRELDTCVPSKLLKCSPPTRASLDEAYERARSIRCLMISSQEELDWSCYRLYDLIEGSLEFDSPPEIALGERAFEIVLARRMADGEETTWFIRHGSTAITKVPAHWPEGYRRLIERRIALIESDRSIRLIERPEHKRRWNFAPWEELEQAALRSWLLDRLEGQNYWQGEPQLKSVAKLADTIRQDAEFMQVAELYADRSDFDASTLLGELVESESVPFLPALRYTEPGQRKRTEWEFCWTQQRHEDRINAEVDTQASARRAALMALVSENNSNVELNPAAAAWVETKLRIEMSEEKARRRKEEVGDIAVPPKYKSGDFQSSTIWRLRGGLDVPKERFVSFPNCSPPAARRARRHRRRSGEP